MQKRIMRSFQLDEISAVRRPANKLARATIMKSDTESAGTEAARADVIARLHEKKLRQFMEMKGCTRQEAEAALGPGPDGAVAKAAPTAADTCVASIEALADYRGVNKHVAIAKFLDTDVGRSLYESYADAKNEPSVRSIAKRRYSTAFEAFVDAFAKNHDGNRWKATNAFLKTELGASLYRSMSEAA
jgi:hypothetical protein